MARAITGTRLAMRLKTEIWARAYIRRCAVAGVIATVVRHGDDDAGAVFVKLNRLDGTAAVYGPAPMSLASDGGGRTFAAHLDDPSTSDAAAEQYLARQIEYDPDLWLIEVEDRLGRHQLGPELQTGNARGCDV
jgi:hypothetical protein